MSSAADYLETLESVVIISGVVGALVVVWIRNRQLQLKSWEQLQSIIDSDTDTRNKINDFLIAFRDPTFSLSCLQEKYQNGERLYLSKELQDFSLVGRHYELLGAAIRQNYLPLKLIRQIVPFPHEFWDETKELREFIRGNWYGCDDPLEEYWENFEWLKGNLAGNKEARVSMCKGSKLKNCLPKLPIRRAKDQTS